MELPPLSPGIQERVIEVVVVFVTVRRGWSGGTDGRNTDKTKHYLIRCFCQSGFDLIIHTTSINIPNDKKKYKNKQNLPNTVLVLCRYYFSSLLSSFGWTSVFNSRGC